MKLFKLIPAISVVTLGFAPIAFTTSCNKDKSGGGETADWEIDKSGYEEFIENRTFSIMSTGKIETEKEIKTVRVYGTGWILGDATPNVYDDYQYYIGTNWHVTQEFKELPNDRTYHYADKSCSSSSTISVNNYIRFNSFKFAKEDRFRYDVNRSNGEVPVIDFFVAKVDFANQKMTKHIKSKLDSLNEIQKDKGFINRFGSLNEFKTGNKYVGGFPYDSTSKGTKWEVHGIKSSVFNYHDIKPHTIGGEGSKYHNYTDQSPQLELSKDAKNFMPGGASGSMIINSNKEICGVYWGGWEDPTTKEYFPTFSFINDLNGAGKRFTDTPYEVE